MQQRIQLSLWWELLLDHNFHHKKIISLQLKHNTAVTEKSK